MIKKIIKILSHQAVYAHEENNIKKLFKNIDKNATILDVGSGKGRNIKFLQLLGFKNILGVEIREESVEFANKNNLKTISVKEFEKCDDKFDIVLFSHIIEHFHYDDLFIFLEKYFSHSKEGGMIIIVTPLPYKMFFNDFDHVKPYFPDGISSVFSDGLTQVQFSSNFILSMQDIYFRKSAFRLFELSRSNYIKEWMGIRLMRLLLNTCLQILHLLTYRLIGRTTGWCALYKINKKTKRKQKVKNISNR